MDGEIPVPVVTTTGPADDHMTTHAHTNPAAASATASAQNLKKRTRSKLSDHYRSAADPNNDATAADLPAGGGGDMDNNAHDSSVVVLPATTGSMHPPAKRIKHATTARTRATPTFNPAAPAPPSSNVSPTPTPNLLQPLDAPAPPTLPHTLYSTHHPHCWFCPYSPFADTSLTLPTPACLKHTYATMTKGPVLPGHISVVPTHHVANWHCIDPCALRARFAQVRAVAVDAVNEVVAMQRVATHRYVREGSVPVTWQVVARNRQDGQGDRPLHAYCQMVGVPDRNDIAAAQADARHVPGDEGNKVELVSVRSKFAFKSLGSVPSSETIRTRSPVTDRIVAAFAALVTSSESAAAAAAPVPAVYEFKVTGTHLLGSLTRALYYARAHARGGAAAAKLNLMGPHAAMLVGDRLVFASGDVDWSIPRRAIVAGGTLDKARLDWRAVAALQDKAGERGERERWVDGWVDEISQVCGQMEVEQGMKVVESEVDVGYYSLGGWTREHAMADKAVEVALHENGRIKVGDDRATGAGVE